MFWSKQFQIIVSLWLLLCSQNANGFIAPIEVVQLSNLFTAGIPKIKKGIDSLLGFGFRLGDHAYFQVVLELGPQICTRRLGVSAMNDQSFKNCQIEQKTTKKPEVKKIVKKALTALQPQMAADAVQQLQQLYRMASSATTSTNTTSSPGESLKLDSQSGIKVPAITQDTDNLSNFNRTTKISANKELGKN